MAQWYMCMRNLQVEVPVLQSLICRLIQLLKPTTLLPTVFATYVSLWSHILHFKHYITFISLQVIHEWSFYLLLLDMTELLPSFTCNKQILQRLYVHLNNSLSCTKFLVSALNLSLDNKRSNFLVAFELKLSYYFWIHTSGDLIVYH